MTALAKTGAVTDGLPTPRRYWAILTVSAGTAVTMIDGGIANVALPTIADALEVPSSAAVSIVTVYQLTLVMLLLPMAALGDRIGLKRLYQAGQGIFVVSSFLCFFANDLTYLLVVRACQAIGASMILSVVSALIRLIYPARHLGRGLGINSVVATSSVAAAPTVGGMLLTVVPWPWVFASAVPFAIVGLVLGRTLPSTPRHERPFDLLGAIACAATFGLIVGGAEAAVRGASTVVWPTIITLGFAVGWLFVRRELRAAIPILPVDLLARPVIALSAAGGFIAFVASMTLLLSTPFRLTEQFGFTPTQIGAVMAPWPLTNMVVAPAAGLLADRVPAGILGGFGMLISITALLLIALLPTDPSWFDLAWRMALCGAGFGLYLPPNARLIVGSSPLARAASAGGMVSTIRLLGQTTGATLVAALLALGVGDGHTPPLVAAGLAVIALLCSIARLRPTFRKQPADAAEETADRDMLPS